MTGYARAEGENGERKCVVEIRTVNHRFLDISMRLPSRDFELEKAIKDIISSRITRGSVDVSVVFSDLQNGNRKLVVDQNIVKQYLSAAKDITNNYPVYGEVGLSDLLNYKDIFKYEEESPDLKERWELMKETLLKALEALIAMRAAEGETLKKDIKVRMGHLKEAADRVARVRDENLKLTAEKVRVRILEMFRDLKVDEQRLLAEAALVADRSDIAEEVTRLKSHLAQAELLLEQGGGSGRKLDFLVQEMNRETNTIGSKSNLYDISHEVVEMKSNLEKIREQAANLE